MVLIECFDLCLQYGGRVVVENFSYVFKSSDYVCIVGENGSGKSTLLNGILGLKASSNGKVVFGCLKKNEIGFLPQKINLKADFPASVFEVVLSGFCAQTGFFNRYSSEQKARVVEILKNLELDRFLNCSFRKLSKGQQQRVLFARAVCASKKILFLDEPCASFDPVVTLQFYNFLKRLQIEHNLAVVMVTHDLKQVLGFAKTIIHLQNKPVFVGSPESYVKTDFGRRFLGGVGNC